MDKRSKASLLGLLLCFTYLYVMLPLKRSNPIAYPNEFPKNFSNMINDEIEV